MSEASGDGRQAIKPRDAASLIVVDLSKPAPTILMGRRHSSHVFMPGKYVFPGGAADRSDRIVASFDEPRDSELQKLFYEMKGQPSQARARGLVMAAIRETFEEAGLIIGRRALEALSPAPEGWTDFFARGYLPAPSGLTFFARAITPPGRPRRFDSRFFFADASAIVERVPPPSHELESLDWFTAEQIRELDLPAITRVVIEDLMDRIKDGALSADNAPVPFYTHRNGTFRRLMIPV